MSFNQTAQQPIFALASRFLLAASQLLVIFFASHALTQIEQGVFSTMRSMVAMTAIFDLGLSVVLVQVVAHIRATDPESEQTRAKLRATLRFASLWYCAATSVSTIVILWSGWHLLLGAHELSPISYVLPWLCICASTGLTMLINPLQAFVEGSGKVISIALMRGAQAFIGALALGVVAYLGGGLWSLAAMSVASMLTGWLWIVLRHHHDFAVIFNAPSKMTVAWRTEIFPFQWRMAISWMCGWIIYQLYVPVLFAHQGPILAGQMGLTMEACAGITSLGMAWVGIKAPAWGRLVARGEHRELDRQYRIATRNALVAVVASTAVFTGGLLALRAYNHPLADRFLPTPALLPLLGAAILNQSVFAMATYLRAHKREPYLAPTVVGAVTLGTWTLVAGPLVGATGLAYAHLVVTLIVGWAWGSLIFRHCRTTWHNESAPKAVLSDSTHD